MDSPDPTKPNLKSRLGNIQRKSLVVSQESLVHSEPLLPTSLLPLVVSPRLEGVNLIAWITGNREWLEKELLKHGGILFRGFNVKSPEDLEGIIAAISNSTLEYTYRSTPRSQVSGNIYTSTEYPADQSIPLHNEMSYTRTWPMKIWFCSLIVAQSGGETPIADSRRVYERISPATRTRFADKKVMYVRNYGEGIDLPWEEVFQTTDKSHVEDYCRRHDIAFEWKGDNRLKTSQVCQAVATHPATGETVWFNQAHLFHVSSLLPSVREVLLREFTEDELPRNTYYGDGSPIEPAALDEIREAFQQESIYFPWQEGDVMMLDNMLAAHGRAPFVGPRKVVVGMAESFGEEDS
ncbi:MAG TPA: TauD/TfdA family dioxygenase [Chloroflexia bacterium]|nr:TauD/TfdA family dioxygenase [Chloroflexia bacterium]